jgi:hypothetical protein
VLWPTSYCKVLNLYITVLLTCVYASVLPTGGAQGAKFLVGMLGQALMSCFGSVQRMVLK